MEERNKLTEKRIAVLIYPHFSMQEISCLTDALSVWYDKKLDIYGATKEAVRTEDGFLVLPEKEAGEFCADDYSCIILPGILEPLPALFDKRIIALLEGLKGKDILIASMCSSSLLLAKAGLLTETKFTSGAFDEMIQRLPFIPTENFCYQALVHDKNIITAMSFAFREFAAETMRALGIELEQEIYEPIKGAYEEDELKFCMGEEMFAEFMEEYETYKAKEERE